MENPLDVLDRTVSSYTGGINTDKYYAQIYANQRNGVPTETLIIEGSNAQSAESRQNMPVQQNQQVQYQGQVTQSQNQAKNQGQNSGQQYTGPQGADESPIDYFLRVTPQDGAQTAPAQTAVQQPAPSAVPVQNQSQQSQTIQTQYTQSVGTKPAVEVTPTGAFGFIVHAAFSIAVVVSVIGLMFIIYIIIRTRQLHHHEHHVKELGGHGGGHGDGHAATGGGHAAASHAPAVHGHAQGDTHGGEVGSTHADTHAHDAPHASPVHDSASHDDSHDGTHADDAHGVDGADEDVHNGAHDIDTQLHDEDEGGRMPVVAPYSPVPPEETLTNDEATLYASRLHTIKEDAASDDEDAWYTALMDINLLLEDIMSEKGFEGTSVKEMLGSEEGKGLATRDVGYEAEAQFQKLISGEEQLTKDAIVGLVNMYAKVCKELGVV